MVRVYSIVVFRHYGDPNTAPVVLASYYNFTSVGYFYRGNAKEVALFVSREVTRHVTPGARGGVTRTEAGQTLNCYYQVLTVPAPDDSKLKNSAHLACCVATDGDYPKLAAISLVGKVINQFLQGINFDDWASTSKDTNFKNNFVGPMLQKYQNPQEADDLEKIKRELAETKDVILESLDLLLQRGERLEDLIDRSNDLSTTSKSFMNESSRLNSWCCTLF